MIPSLKAICISCGSSKSSYQTSCPDCSFKPKTDEELAKSRILSTPWSFGLPDGDVLETGRSAPELESIARRIQSGAGYDYPPAELKSMMQIVQQSQAMTGWMLLRDGIKWLAVPIGLLILFWIILTKLR